METKPTTALVKGLVISLIIMVLSLVWYYANLIRVSGLQYVFTVIEIAGVVWAVWYYGKQIDYNAGFGKYFSHGFTVTAFITLFMIAFVLVEVYLIPGFKDEMLQMSAEQVAKNKNMSPEQVQQGQEIFQKYFNIFVLSGTLFSYLFFGTIGALLGAGITRKAPKQIFD